MARLLLIAIFAVGWTSQRTQDAAPTTERGGVRPPHAATTPGPATPVADHGIPARPGRGARRLRRCTCSSMLDTDCIYYCHMDIIWVNTAVRTVPYGVGSRTRGRRRVGRACISSEAGPGRGQRNRCPPHRCRCSLSDDQHCGDFCRMTGARP
ncbi:endothelin-1-like [Lethenteron reissneri]|uniref:endothelin-1-like n=1 Tax=Lethenteron reissneri TaxID=7753 RepID=UPI002AB6B50F|nr:endothelin-1-like [Lethenteron reissneri]